ncbi:hypothetical protein [Mixta calida]|uniref:hypothetical protein n=1 Tax=Mixta calida TaxID=665913 RepID=UPI0034D78DAB
MIDIKNSVVIGGAGRGLHIPGALVLGGNDDQGSGVSIIDLTSLTLVPRVTYRGPSYRYFNAAGELMACAADEWPLVYRDGVAIGRREPLPAVTNVITSLQAESLSAGAKDGWLTRYTETGSNGGFHRLRFNTTQTGSVTLQLFYQPFGRDYLCLRVATGSANNYKNVGVAGGDITYTGDGITDVAITDCGGGLYLLRCTFSYVSGVLGLLTADTAVTDDAVPRPATTNTTAGFAIGYPTLVAGELSAPPLAIGESLAAASVVLDTSAVSQIIVHYSDSTAASYDTPGAAFTLPTGDRYIQRIEMRS